MPPSGRIHRICSHSRQDDAQTLAEYAVVLAVITPILVLAFVALSSAVLPVYENVRGFL
jgi:Flp pilus assembly pilin Flp